MGGTAKGWTTFRIKSFFSVLFLRPLISYLHMIDISKRIHHFNELMNIHRIWDVDVGQHFGGIVWCAASDDEDARCGWMLF